MRIKELFTVPEGQKITEKALTKVLISSVCSIILCMTCLFGTTWAWFAVSIENTGNVIEIATVTADVTIKKGDVTIEPTNGQYDLDAGTYNIWIRINNNATEQKAPVYVIMTVTENGETSSYYCVFDPVKSGVEKTGEFTISGSDVKATVTFSVSWVKPASAAAVGDKATITSDTPMP